MVSSADVPDQFMVNWRTGSRSELKNPHLSRPATSKLCSACDACREARVKCTGETQCRRCRNANERCHYSASMRSGRRKAWRIQQATGRTPESSDASINDALEPVG